MNDLDAYHELIARKRVAFEPRGLAKIPALNGAMHPLQAHSTDFALRTGCSALFLDTGLGKTFSALEWGRVIVEHTNRPVLMLAPLAVAGQHQREAERWGIDALAIREPHQVIEPRVYITNYDRLPKFDVSKFSGVVLDESSILKSFTGSTSRALISKFAQTPYRLACSATPAPNDHMELGQHSAFLGAMASNEMLARWFIADQTNMGRYRLKSAAVRHFWDWVASWARCVSKPSDLGFSDDGYVLPPLNMHRHIVEADRSLDTGAEKDGQARLFRLPDMSATSIHKEKRMTIDQRADVIAALVATEPNEPWVVWCDTDYEADALIKRIPDGVEVRGSMTAFKKEMAIDEFSTGKTRVMITKPGIAGYGLNWQHCARVAFVGLSFSYESFYQAIRRCWRFGQTRAVEVHVACADSESIWTVVSRKSGDHDAMKAHMSAAMRRAARLAKVYEDYDPQMEVQFPEFLKEVA